MMRPTPPSKPAASPSSLASAPIPSPSPTPTPSPSPTPTPAPYWQTVERNGEIEGYGYVPDFVDMQTTWSDLIARVRLLSVEPSYRIDSPVPTLSTGTILMFTSRLAS